MTTPEIEELKSLIEQNTERCSVPLQTSRSFQSTSNKMGQEHILLHPQTPIRLRKRRPQAKKYNTRCPGSIYRLQ